MDIGTLDYYANFGSSFIHKASAGFKVVFAVSLIASIIVTKSIIILASIYVLLLGFVMLSGVPALKVILLASYPGIFAMVFAFASWNGSWMFSLLIILKAISASLCMVFIIVTTSYPKVFATLKPLMPRLIFDAFLLTYRSIILLMGLLSDLFSALSIRGGFHTPSYFRKLKNLSSGLALLIIRGFDLSHNFYGVLNIRGYDGKIDYSGLNTEVKPTDFIFAITGSVILILTVYAEEFKMNLPGKYLLIICILFFIFAITKRAISNVRYI